LLSCRLDKPPQPLELLPRRQQRHLPPLPRQTVRGPRRRTSGERAGDASLAGSRAFVLADYTGFAQRPGAAPTMLLSAARPTYETRCAPYRRAASGGTLIFGPDALSPRARAPAAPEGSERCQPLCEFPRSS
jgi:hypothetical protein